MKALLVLALFAGCALCQDEVDLNKLKDSIPGFENIDQSKLPNKEEVEKKLREKCEKNGGIGAYDDIINSVETIKACFEKQVNTTVLMEELEEAKKDGSMDEVFGKYCKERSTMMDCVKDVTKKVEKCLEPSEKDNMKIVMNVTESLAEFMCYKDGDRLAMFVAEGGFECVDEHKEGLQACANKTFSNKIPTDLSINNLPLFTIGETECADMLNLQECAVTELEKCKDNTPANLVEALFKFIRRATPCNTMSKPAQQGRNIEQMVQKIKRSEHVEFNFITTFKDKCRKYAGPNAYRDLDDSVNRFKASVQSNLRSQNACDKLKTEVLNNTRFVINKLRVCLPPEESYLPDFSHASINALLKYLCDNEGKNFNRLIYSNGLPCLFRNDPKSLNMCLEGTKSKRPMDNVVSKVELCENLNKVEMCLLTYINNHCPSELQFSDVTKGIMTAVRAPCTGCSIQLSILLLLTCLLYNLKKSLL